MREAQRAGAVHRPGPLPLQRLLGPDAYGFQAVLVKGFVAEVVILCEGVQIARHTRAYGEGVFVYDPLHYLALIETKPGALEQAAALQD